MLFELLDSKIEEIGEENVVQVVIDNASNHVAAGRHTRLLEAMRVHTRGADLVRAEATRFASSFLTLQSLLKHKDNLRKLFLSDHWDNSKLSHTEAGKQIVEIILFTPFWNDVQDCLRASLPLIQVLRIVDGDERLALPEMERPIYLAVFLLNPSKYFSAIEKESDESIVNSLMHKANDAFNDILTRMVPDTTLQDKISAKSAAYTGSNGSFAKEMIHTKKRNMLEHQRLNDLVYIQYNRRLQVRFQEKREQSRNPNPLVLDDLDWSSEWMTGISDDELVHPGDDLTWRTVSTVSGASSLFHGTNRVRRSGPSTSGAAPALASYSRRNRVHEESSDDELEFGLELNQGDVHDDEDVEDDFGIQSNVVGNEQEEEDDLNILNWE
ncbi:uncharacterized protein LOC122639207 [Telopea speciosissima]|uniref:uncharacterized protein LOC122639207 n=1 Tax=Telopea speciosissima TaxID=54955 RepID=UPI001CC38452|nr:uncharacterized protein LOC122639207 [Telopea speciosissima]